MPWGVAAAAVVGAVAADNAQSKAERAQSKASNKATHASQMAAIAAKEDVNRLFDSARQTGQEGFQGALNVFGQSLPAQATTFQQGNLGAQQAILSGLPQIQNALFGNQVDFSQMQPFQLQAPNVDFFQQELPQVAARRMAAEEEAARQANRDRVIAGGGIRRAEALSTGAIDLGQGRNSGQLFGGNANFFNQNTIQRP